MQPIIKSINQIAVGSESIIAEVNYQGNQFAQTCMKFVPHGPQTAPNLDIYQTQTNFSSMTSIEENCLEQNSETQIIQPVYNNQCNKFCQMLKNEVKVAQIVKNDYYLNLPFSFNQNVKCPFENSETGCYTMSTLAKCKMSQKKAKSLQNLDSFQDGYIHDLLELQIEFQNQLQSIKALREILFQIILGLDTLHSKNISHNDIKPENVLVYNYNFEENKFKVKITDFGLSNINCKKSINIQQYLQQDSTYFSPELIQLINSKNNQKLPVIDEQKCDIYAVGLLILSILFNTDEPISQQQQQQLFKLKPEQFKNILKPKQQIQILRKFSNKKEYLQLLEIISIMLKKNPEERQSASDLLSKDFFNQEDI